MITLLGDLVVAKSLSFNLSIRGIVNLEEKQNIWDLNETGVGSLFRMEMHSTSLNYQIYFMKA